MPRTSLKLMIIACLFAVQATAGAEQFGSKTLDALSFPASARLDAMAAGVALPGDGSSLLRNPATLADTKHLRTTMHFRDWYGDTHVTRVGLAADAPGGSLGLDLIYMSEGEVQDLDTATWAFGDTYQNGHFAIVFGYAFVTGKGENIDLGLSIEYLRRTLLGESGGRFGLSTGAAVGLWEDALRLGVNLTGVSTDMDLGEDLDDEVPVRLVGGCSLEGATVAGLELPYVLCAEAVQVEDLDLGFRAGTELWVVGPLCLRAGYDSTTEDSPLRFGLGAHVGQYDLDVAYAAHDVLGSTYSFSVSYYLGH